MCCHSEVTALYICSICILYVTLLSILYSLFLILCVHFNPLILSLTFPLQILSKTVACLVVLATTVTKENPSYAYEDVPGTCQFSFHGPIILLQSRLSYFLVIESTIFLKSWISLALSFKKFFILVVLEFDLRASC